MMLFHLAVISSLFAYATCTQIKESVLDEVKAIFDDVHRIQMEALLMVRSDRTLNNLQAMISERNPIHDVFPSASIQSFKDEAKRLFLASSYVKDDNYDVRSENDYRRWFIIVGCTVTRYFINGKDDFKDLAKVYMRMIVLAIAFYEANKILGPEFRKSIEKEKNELFEHDAIIGSIQMFTLLEDNNESVSDFVGNYETEPDIHHIQSIFKFMKSARRDPKLQNDPAFKRFDFKLTAMIAKRQREKIRHVLAESKDKLLGAVRSL
ncbi:hypothetical protein MP638_003358 [Amoeboaphelidium occidentale]|nr:hypothetical protein MP638_003358 [Amoeboaphelidium occidentale]